MGAYDWSMELTQYLLGQALRLLALKLLIACLHFTGSIEYRVKMPNYKTSVVSNIVSQ